MIATALIMDLYSKDRKALISFAYSLCKNRQDAQDAVHEALCRVLARPNLQIEHLRGYLFRAIRNISVDRHRKQTSEASFMKNCGCSDEDCRSPERILIDEENLREVTRAIARIPHKAQRALVMLRLEGSSYEDVARHFHIKVHSARRLAERAVIILKQTVGAP